MSRDLQGLVKAPAFQSLLQELGGWAGGEDFDALVSLRANEETPDMVVVHIEIDGPLAKVILRMEAK